MSRSIVGKPVSSSVSKPVSKSVQDTVVIRRDRKARINKVRRLMGKKK